MLALGAMMQVSGGEWRSRWVNLLVCHSACASAALAWLATCACATGALATCASTGRQDRQAQVSDPFDKLRVNAGSEESLHFARKSEILRRWKNTSGSLASRKYIGTM